MKMLAGFLKRIFSARSPISLRGGRDQSFLLIAQSGDIRSTIAACRRHLERFPHDVEVMNNLGCALFDIGEVQEAFSLYEQAYSLDDTYLPTVINHARSLLDRHLISEGMKLIRQAKVFDPENPNVASVYAGMEQMKGNAQRAARYALNAWMGDFDNLRLANCSLFYASYDDIDGMRLAAEHRFWAETLMPLPNVAPDVVEDDAPESESERGQDGLRLPPKGERVRIAYFSPDLRNHSVGFFALPLFKNHDRSRFEVLVYHDSSADDTTTEAVKAGCDHFIKVVELTDAALTQMMQEHDLDILVEAAGHSSSNRLPLLRRRLARVQISGLGYPPTTGLSTIDAKILDVHIVDEDSDRYYTETPLVMDHSFWCFDGGEAVPISPEPPCVENGFLTFACSGNIAKISDRMLACWVRIFEKIPDCRLLIRSLSFSDSEAVRNFCERSEKHGLDMQRVSLLGPAQGMSFFESYNAVDVVLDTYPFNGGTTTCFATYMGVPVLSMAGDSLVSRMGKSILSNLEMHDWIVRDFDEYVEKAVSLSSDVERLRAFRREARGRYSNVSLGNGERFTREFERKCMDMLEGRWQHMPHRVPVLPLGELLSRAYRVCRYAQFDAAARIVDHCIANYPESGSARVLWTQRLASTGAFQEAANYLDEHLEGVAGADKFNVLVNIARFNILAGRPDDARVTVSRMTEHVGNASLDQLQMSMLQAYASAELKDASVHPTVSEESSDTNRISKIQVLVFADDFSFLSTIEHRFRYGFSIPRGVELSFRLCPEVNRRKNYIESLQNSDIDAIVAVHKHISIVGEQFVEEVLAALNRFDMIGVGGAKSWERLDWRHGDINEKASCLVIPSGEREGFFEILHSGISRECCVGDMAVLDGSILVMRTSAFRDLDVESLFDPVLEDSALYLEEYFSFAAHCAGVSLAAHQNLGVVVDWRVPLAGDYVREARWHLNEKFGFDPFGEDEDGNRAVVSIPVESVEVAFSVTKSYFQHPQW